MGVSLNAFVEISSQTASGIDPPLPRGKCNESGIFHFLCCNFGTFRGHVAQNLRVGEEIQND